MKWNIERDLTDKNCILVDFSHHWYLYVMNVDHEFTALDWNYASIQDTAGHRTQIAWWWFPYIWNWPEWTYRCRTIYFQSIDIARTSNIFQPISRRSGKILKLQNSSLWMQIHAVSAWKSVKFAVKMTNERKIQFMALGFLSIFHVTYVIELSKQAPALGARIEQYSIVLLIKLGYSYYRIQHWFY